jgi:Outer membrane protein beta-barrel domain
MRKPAFVLLLMCLALTAAHSQKNEFAVLASSFQTSASGDVHGGTGLQLNYARRIVHIPLASLYLELPFAAAWGGNLPFYHSGYHLNEDFNTLYITPGLKLKILPSSFISPYLAGGLGWGSFRTTNPSSTSNQFAGDIGGGADFKILPILSLRGEVRDYYTSGSILYFPTVNGTVNNVVISGGAVFRF